MKAIFNPILRSAELTLGDETKTIHFEGLEEWQSVTINGMQVDIKFDYEPRNNFGSQPEWLHYILQAYPIGSRYENQLIDHIKLEL